MIIMGSGKMPNCSAVACGGWMQLISPDKVFFFYILNQSDFMSRITNHIQSFKGFRQREKQTNDFSSYVDREITGKRKRTRRVTDGGDTEKASFKSTRDKCCFA